MSVQLTDQLPAPAGAGRPQPSSTWLRSNAAAAAIVFLLVVGVVLRAIVADQSLFADELSTYWISATHSLPGVISLMYGTPHIAHPEITPPLYFVAAWLTSQFGHASEWLRLPSLLAGAVTIPLVYLVGLRTVRRPAALVAAALSTLAPFMIYYSTEARAYGVMMMFVVASTLSLLTAVDTGRVRWWVAYGVCSCAAFYSHYTSAFVLGPQLLWLLWAYPSARRGAVLANLGAAVALLPWIPGLINDFNSPTLRILSDLSPFTAGAVTSDVEHWALGYPYSIAGSLTALPGLLALVLLGLATILAAGAVLRRFRDRSPRDLIRSADRRVLLVVLLALTAPAGEAIISLGGNHIFGVRNMAASWPFLALSYAAFLIAAGGRTKVVASLLAVVALALGAAKMLSPRFQRLDYQSAAALIDRQARQGDVVIDGTGVISPGPLTGLDVSLHAHNTVIRAFAPAERGHPFDIFDPYVSLPEAIQEAVGLAHSRRVFLVVNALHVNTVALARAGYQVTEQHVFTGFRPTVVRVYAPRG